MPVSKKNVTLIGIILFCIAAVGFREELFAQALAVQLEKTGMKLRVNITESEALHPVPVQSRSAFLEGMGFFQLEPIRRPSVLHQHKDL